MTPLRRISTVSLVLAFVTAAACSHPPPPPPPQPTGPTPEQLAAQARADSIAKARADSIKKAYDDSVAAAKAAADAAAARAAAEAEAARREAARRDSIARAEADSREATATITQVVHFDFDKAELRDDTKAALDAKIPILRANPNLMIRIAGNTDERGSNQYNLALGQRRAAAAKQYLVDRGIPDARIETISYGEEHKLCDQKDESCWSQNRRDEFEITSGGNNLKKQ